VRDDVIRMSVLEGAFVLAQHLAIHPEIDPEDAVKQLANGPLSSASYDFYSAAAILKEFGTSPFRRNVAGDFDLKASLFTILVARRPFWARASIFGRKRVRQLLNENEEQCLAAAGLLERELAREALEWWDRLALAFQAAAADARLESGRAAEELTLDYENSRLADEFGTGFVAKWISPEDNTTGYDIESFAKHPSGNVAKLLIEVKGFRSSDRKFFITRREWWECTTTPFLYRFYIWDLNTRQLAIFRKEDIEPHMPLERGAGQWTSVELSLDKVKPR
jgi:hypothetical protein